MVEAFHNEQQVQIDGEQLTLVINFAALDAAEQMLKRSFDEVRLDIYTGTVKLSDMAVVIWALLRDRHSEMTLDQATTLLFGERGETIGLAILKLLGTAWPAPDPTKAKAKAKNPRQPRGASPNS